MKKVTTFMAILATLTLTSCTENYSNGTRIGTINKFSKSGYICKSWEGHLNVTQTGMTSTPGFDFSIDNDNEPEGLVKTLDSAMNYGWKVELNYHEVFGKNWFSNRGSTDHFVSSCKVIDRNFSTRAEFTENTNLNINKDTIININVSLNEARKLGWIK